jgi:hypothetical protein
MMFDNVRKVVGIGDHETLSPWSFGYYRGQEIIYDIERAFCTYPEKKLEYKCECARLII